MNLRAVLGLCALGFLLRLTYSLATGSDALFPDELRFLEEGESLLSGTGLQANGKYGHDMPMTGLVVAAGLYISGGSIMGVKLIMAVLSTVTIFLVARLCFSICQDNRATLLAAFICAIYPFFIFYSARVLSETVFLFFMMLFFWLLFDKSKSPLSRGVAAGLMHLTKPIFFYLFPLIWVWQYVVQKMSLKNVLLGVLATLVVASPWVIRNHLIFDDLVVNTASSGHILWEGNNPWNKTGGVSGTFEDPVAWLAVVPEGLSELEEDEWKKAEAIAFIRSHPIGFVENGVRKLKRFWNLWPNSANHQGWIYKLISLGSFGPVLLLSMIGAILLKQYRKELLLMLGVAAYLSALHAVIIGSIRYRLPLEPLMIVVASMTLADLRKKQKAPLTT